MFQTKPASMNCFSMRIIIRWAAVFLVLTSVPLTEAIPYSEYAASCVDITCLNNGSCQVDQTTGYPECICKPEFIGVHCQLDIVQDVLLPVVIPVIASGAFKNMTIRKVPDIPILLSILKDLVSDVTPCLLPCLVDQIWELFNAFALERGPYATCVQNAASRATYANSPSTSTTTSFIGNLIELLSNTHQICPIAGDTFDCLMNTLASSSSCGAGIVRHIVNTGLRDDLLSLLDCVPGRAKLNIAMCITTYTNPVLGNPSILAEVLHCFRGLEKKLLSAAGWKDLYAAEADSNFPQLCSAVKAAGPCAMNILKRSRTGMAINCQRFDDFILENLNSVMEQMNCYKNGTEVFRCLSNPALYQTASPLPALTSFGTGPTNSPFFTCTDEWSSQAANVLNLIPRSQLSYITEKKIMVLMESIAKRSCGLVKNTLSCLLDTTGKLSSYPGCASILLGVKTIFAPAVSKFNQFGGCISEFNKDETMAIAGCQCMSSGATPSPHCPNVTISAVQPSKGPMAGGTMINITGQSLDSIQRIHLGKGTCEIYKRTNVRIMCYSAILDTRDRLLEALEVKVNQIGLVGLRKTGFTFQYKENPVIFKVHPLYTIPMGGIRLTVSGKDLDIANRRVMMTTLTSLITARSATYDTPCATDSPDQMTCPTPPIDFNEFNRMHRSQQETVKKLNSEWNIELTIAFELDGVPDYKNLSGGKLDQYSRVTAYADPVIKKFDPPTLTFTSTWPVEDKSITVEGEELSSLPQFEYSVKIGVAGCEITELYSNRIICEPPPSRPNVAPEDYVSDNRIPVKVWFASQQSFVGYLSYQQNLWEYPTSRNIIIGTSVLICVALAAAVIFCKICRVCKKKPPATDDISLKRTNEEFPPQRRQLGWTNLVKQCRRKSTNRPRVYRHHDPPKSDVEITDAIPDSQPAVILER